jgi:YHS domain-containing protein
VQGPEPYLKDFNIELPCAVDSLAMAILDAEHRAFVNHEVYYFSSIDAKHRFEVEPFKYTGRVTDPVSLQRFQPGPSSPSRNAAGRFFYFQSDATLAVFDKEPARYSTPKPGMKRTD